MKAQGLPISTIIIAALGLLVLVVIGAIFGGQITKFGRVTNECIGRCLVSDPAMQTKASNIGLDVDTDANCNAAEREISGKYIAQGQAGVKPGDLVFCNKCCATTG